MWSFALDLSLNPNKKHPPRRANILALFFSYYVGKTEERCYVHGGLPTQITLHLVLDLLSTLPLSVSWKPLFIYLFIY